MPLLRNGEARTGLSLPGLPHHDEVTLCVGQDPGRIWEMSEEKAKGWGAGLDEASGSPPRERRRLKMSERTTRVLLGVLSLVGLLLGSYLRWTFPEVDLPFRSDARLPR